MGIKCPAENLAADGGGEEDSGQVSGDSGSDGEGGGFGDEERRDFLFGGAEGFEDADLFGAFHDHLTEVAGDAEGGNGEDDQ